MTGFELGTNPPDLDSVIVTVLGRVWFAVFERRLQWLQQAPFLVLVYRLPSLLR